MIYLVTNEVFEFYKTFAANDEYFAQRAQVKAQMLNAYVNAGFTREEAIEFILNSDNNINKIASTYSNAFCKANI